MQFFLDPTVLLALAMLLVGLLTERSGNHRGLAMLQGGGGIVLLLAAAWARLFPGSTSVRWLLVAMVALAVAAGAWHAYRAWRGIRAMRDADRSAEMRMKAALDSPPDGA